MAWAPDYATVAELKTFLGITDAADDTALATAITAASRAIDASAHRQFGKTAATEARVYSYDGLRLGSLQMVAIDDVMTVTDLTVAVDYDGSRAYASTWVTADFDLFPHNAPVSGVPWTHLVVRSTGTYRYFPKDHSAIRVTATWGWTAVPGVVKQAALLQAERLFKRREAPFGVAGSAEYGSELRLLNKLDPDVDLLISSVRRWDWAMA
jgi:hypothetical protein